MGEKTTDKQRPDRDTYVKNRCSWLPEQLAPYGEQWVAWSSDASRIVAHHEDLLETVRMVEASGISREDVNFEWIPPGGEVDSLL
jgi:hypothetical protein